MTGLWAALTDLVLPASCAGCGSSGERLAFEVCARCVSAIEALRPGPCRPTPAPPGLPPAHALGDYGGELRELLLEFKERGRHRLARPLGALLAEVVVSAVPGNAPLLLLYIPDTRAAAARRHGDHLRRLADEACRRLATAGREVLVGHALRAAPKPDSAHLGIAGRAATAREAFAVNRFGWRAVRHAATRRTVVLLDDILTTGSTLANAAERLAEAEVEVHSCAVLAATTRRLPA